MRTKASDPLADMMFNDWQIVHFHLGTIFVGPKKVCRTRDVLFAFIALDHAVFLDVKPHGRGARAPWAMQDLLRVLLRVNPKIMADALQQVQQDIVIDPKHACHPMRAGQGGDVECTGTEDDEGTVCQYVKEKGTK